MIDSIEVKQYRTRHHSIALRIKFTDSALYKEMKDKYKISFLFCEEKNLFFHFEKMQKSFDKLRSLLQDLKKAATAKNDSKCLSMVDFAKADLEKTIEAIANEIKIDIEEASQDSKVSSIDKVKFNGYGNDKVSTLFSKPQEKTHSANKTLEWKIEKYGYRSISITPPLPRYADNIYKYSYTEWADDSWAENPTAYGFEQYCISIQFLNKTRAHEFCRLFNLDSECIKSGSTFKLKLPYADSFESILMPLLREENAPKQVYDALDLPFRPCIKSKEEIEPIMKLRQN